MGRLRSVHGARVLALGGLLACGSGADDASTPSSQAAPAPAVAQAPAPQPGERALVLLFGEDVPPAVRDRLKELLSAHSPLPVRVADPNADLPQLASDALVLSFGDAKATRTIVDASALANVGPEGFIVRSGIIAGAPLVAAVGNAPAKETSNHGNLGTAFAAYALLEQLGFAFLHPLAPTLPATFAVPSSSIAIAESPAWRVRGMHLHTMHPLELTDLLQGFGKDGPDDESGWTSRLPEWDRFLEWMVANRQNRVEWVLLYADSWKDFADGPARQQRFGTLVDHAHAWGIAAGADAPLALEQQHTWRLVRQTGDLDAEKAQIDQRLDWLFAAGFDFFSTESGSTEFTHPDPTRMLAWMNEAAIHSRAAHSAPTYIKAHCSTGQTADGFVDPVSGGPLNFNFLPHYADAALGVMPHTVQIYGFSDPAPTYGNTDFLYMKDFLEQEVGTREVIWHPETAYWVTYDIDVPLFLPLYAERRVADLRTLAADERAAKMGRGANAGKRMDGQMIFSSGWEWGYWLNDVVAARAAWNPHLEAPSDREALVSTLEPLRRALGAAGTDAVTWIADAADAQAALLVRGEVGGVAPRSVVQRNGMAYLEGFDAMADVASTGGNLGVAASPITQPARLGLVDMRNPVHSGPTYATDVAPLLSEMETRFSALATRGAGALASAPPEARDLADDLADAAQMTALRAQQMHGLYDYVAGWPFGDMTQRKARLQTARDALDTAARIVAAREKRYRVEADRIASWRNGPTAYTFAYLWPVRSLYFWWRDEGKAVDAPVSPCYENIMSPADIALGEGIVADTAQAFHNALGSSATDCLSAPATEPQFPQDNLRSRP
jgi:hypothetical protein